MNKPMTPQVMIAPALITSPDGIPNFTRAQLLSCALNDFMAFLNKMFSRARQMGDTVETFTMHYDIHQDSVLLDLQWACGHKMTMLCPNGSKTGDIEKRMHLSGCPECYEQGGGHIEVQ